MTGERGKRKQSEGTSIDDEITKMDKLAQINANARYELLKANQQLLNFQLKVRAG